MHQFLATFDDSESSVFARFIVAEIPFGESVRYVLESLYQNLPPEERTNASIILRPGVRFQLSKARIEQLSSEGLGDGENLEQRYSFLEEIVEDVEKAFRRFRTHGIHVLASEDYDHYLTANINPAAAAPLDISDVSLAARLIDTIRDAEIDHLVRIGGCKLPRLGQIYYRAPSGRYMKAFLRVGNLQISRSAIDALYFWLIPHLRNCIGIITDTWSISSISQNCSRRLVDYEGAVRPPCPIEMLGDYHDQSEHYGSAAAETIDRFISRIEAREGGGAGQVLILISATHTGSMVELIQRYLEPRGIATEKVSFVSLFKLSPASSIPTLRDLSEDEDFAVVDELTEEEKSTAIQIHSTLYFPATPLDIEKPLPLDVIKPYAEFARRYADISFARVHRTDSDSNPSNRRHHALWIDTAKLISHPKFAELFRQKLLALVPRPAIIIHPDHSAAHALAEVADEIFRSVDTEVPAFPHNDLKLIAELSHEDEKIRIAIENLGSSEAILFLDDAFITGTRITSYQKNLRDFGFAGAYYYLVAISRPEANRIWDDQRRAFIRARAPQSVDDGGCAPENVFDYVEKLVLPNWAEDRCPWCAEGKQFARMREAQHAEPLSSAAEGMDRDIFIVPKDYDSLELKPGSFVGPPGLAQSNVFCVIAGALQLLRTERVDGTPLLGERYFLIKPVLNESYYLRYLTDSVLMATIFRATTASELVFGDTDKEKRRTRAIRAYLRTKTTGDLVCEVALAESLGKFPQIRTIDPTTSADLAKLFAEEDGSSDDG